MTSDISWTPKFKVIAIEQNGQVTYGPNISAWPFDNGPKFFPGYFCDGCPDERDGFIRYTTSAGGGTQVTINPDNTAAIGGAATCLMTSWVGPMGSAYGHATVEINNTPVDGEPGGVTNPFNATHGSLLPRRYIMAESFPYSLNPTTAPNCPQLEIIPTDSGATIGYDNSIWFVVVP